MNLVPFKQRLMKFTRLLLLLLSLAVTGVSNAQDSCQLQISLLTCSPGAELYSTFGHTAIRVKDLSGNTDVVFNYGTFDDSDPNFYLNFTKGLMEYALSAYPMSDFVEEYKMQDRGVIEQVLNLSCAAKQQLFIALQVNATESKRYYNYYFKEDNCTTRAKEMIEKNALAKVVFNTILPKQHPTFRNLIHIYLDSAHQYWSKFGIDILLGSNLDKRVTNEEAMFLPDFLLKGFDNAQADGKPLVKSKQTIITVTAPASSPSIFTPVLLFWIFFALIAIGSFSKSKGVQNLLKGFDVLFFLVLGLLGVLMLTLWIIRIDTVCRNNFNLLWALPTHLPVIFFYFSKKNWVRNYFRIVALVSVATAIGWFFLPQQFNAAFMPLIFIIILRSFVRAKKK